MNINNVTVSVIIPSFNQGEYLSESLQSVFLQTYKNYEIIIIDDASDDGFSSDIALTLANENVRLIVNTENLGVCASRNKAISESIGKYILPLDADDKIEPTYIEKAVEIIESGLADVVYCKARTFGAKNKVWNLAPFSFYRMLYGNIVFNCALYRKSDWAVVGGYSELFRTGYEDWDFWLSFLRLKKTFYRIDESLFYYRQQMTSRNSSAINKHDQLAKVIFEKHRDLYALFGIESPPCLADLKKMRIKKNRLTKVSRLIYGKAKELIDSIFCGAKVKLYNSDIENPVNFGDVINVPLIEKLSGKVVKFAHQKNANCLCIGNFLDDFLLKRGEMPYLGGPLHVWGSGFLAPELEHPVLGHICEEQFSRRVVFHAVRGYLSLNRLRRMHLDVHETVVGDPRLLAPHLLPQLETIKRYSIGLISRNSDVIAPIFTKLNTRFSDSIIIKSTESPAVFLNKISQCHMVISDTVHGLIAADSIGVPNIALRISDVVDEEYELMDYYSAFSVTPNFLNTSELLSISSEDLARIADMHPIKFSDVVDIQKRLLKAFPFV